MGDPTNLTQVMLAKGYKMRTLTFLLALFLSQTLKADIDLTKLGALKCESETFCRERCNALKEAPSFCSASNKPHDEGRETGFLRTIHCNDWDTVCISEDLYIERGTPNPAYNWKVTRVKDTCWMKESSLTPALRNECAPSTIAASGPIRVDKYADCVISDVKVDSDYYLRPIACGGICAALKAASKGEHCSTEGGHPGAPPSEWGQIYVGTDSVCFETSKARVTDAQRCYELVPKPSMGRD